MAEGKEKIIVSGAGLVGSLLAALLAKRGYAVEVFEKRGDPRRRQMAGGRSINLALSHRGWKALSLIGVENQVRKIALPMKQRIMHDRQGNITYQPYGKDGQAIYSVSRALLNQILIEEADRHANVNFHFNHSCTSVDLSAGEIVYQNADNSAILNTTAEVIFGSDGAFSAIRAAMQKTDRFNYSQHYISSGYKELEIPPINGDFALDPEALHIWPRGSFMMIALPNPDRTFTATLFLPFEGEKAFEHIEQLASFRQFIHEEFPDLYPLLSHLERDFHQNPVSSLVTVRCSPWVHGKFALIGDAAHAIVPFYGQGMNSGFEDCSVLDSLIEQHQGNWKAILPAYQAERIPNANAISDLALHNYIEMRDRVADPEFLLQKQMEAHIQDQYPDKWLPLYSMVTFSHTPYREALAKGRQQDQIMRTVMQNQEVRANWQHLDFGKFIDFEALKAKPAC